LYAPPTGGAFLLGRRIRMAVSYKKLWKLLIDKDMKKKELCAKAGISPSSLTKMGNNGHVTTEVLAKICTALGCTVDDIMEVIPDHEENIDSTAKDTV
jgi:DNA-binding Xre family transcriptional regulator